MIRLLGISGSLRAASLNTALLRALAEAAGDAAALEIATLHGIPVYDGDLEEAEGIPASVEALKDKLRAADGLLLATPEYNNGMPGVLKNAIDWLSRPPKESGALFGGRPVAVVGATPGGMGTVLAQTAWLPVLRTLGMQPWFGDRLQLSRAHKLFDESGGLEDDDTRERLRDFVRGFAAFAAERNHDRR